MFILKILNFHNHKTELFFEIETSNCCNSHYNSTIYGRNKKKTMNISKYPKQEKQGKYSFNSKKKYNYC